MANKHTVTTDFGQSPYKFAEDVRTFVTFEFDQGVERVEFPYFETYIWIRRSMMTTSFLDSWLKQQLPNTHY